MQVQQLTCVGSYVYPLLLMLTLLQLFCTGLVVAPDASTDNVNDNVNDDDDSNDIGGDNSVPHLGALQDCDYSTPLGMISGDIQDWQLSASSTYPQEWDKNCHERYARLYQANGRGWCARYKTSSEWLQVDLGVAAKVTAVLTQGRGDGEEWVTAFMISHSMDAFHWNYITDLYGNQRLFEGNVDSYSVKTSYFSQSVVARFIKFHTVEWTKHPSLRVEIIGCQVCKTLLTLPPFTKLTASSQKVYQRGSSCRADDAHIIANKAWCAKDNNVNQWLQFDIGPPTLVTGLVTKGRGDTRKKHWVTKYRLSYSNDSQIWFYYKDASHLDPKSDDRNGDGEERMNEYSAKSCDCSECSQSYDQKTTTSNLSSNCRLSVGTAS